jgi:hypothetical protein
MPAAALTTAVKLMEGTGGAIAAVVSCWNDRIFPKLQTKRASFGVHSIGYEVFGISIRKIHAKTSGSYELKTNA